MVKTLRGRSGQWNNRILMCVFLHREPLEEKNGTHSSLLSPTSLNKVLCKDGDEDFMSKLLLDSLCAPSVECEFIQDDHSFLEVDLFGRPPCRTPALGVRRSKCSEVNLGNARNRTRAPREVGRPHLVPDFGSSVAGS